MKRFKAFLSLWWYLLVSAALIVIGTAFVVLPYVWLVIHRHEIWMIPLVVLEVTAFLSWIGSGDRNDS